jgi:flavin reductase (DIM6/NTAB) family NADH-FMN oxidoreductase RutF
VGFINRPKDAAPHTIANIERNKVYSMNLVTEQLVASAHQASAKYAEEVDEFDAVQLRIETVKNIQAPFVQESPIKYALELIEIIPIRHNNTFLIVGQITDVLLPENIINSDGFLHLEKENIITSLGIDAYYTTNPLARFAYAKPDRWPIRV